MGELANLDNLIMEDLSIPDQPLVTIVMLAEARGAAVDTLDEIKGV